MAVTNVQVKVQYTGDGSTTKFSIPMAFYIDPNDTTKALIDAGGDLNVYFNSPAVLQNTGYTVYGPGDPVNPSSVIFNTAPSGGQLITIARELPLTQLHRYVPGTPLDASAIEEGLDKLTMICQQLQEEINRAALLDISIVSNQPIQLPAPIANDYLRWDPTGTFLIDDPGPTVTIISGQVWPFRVVFDTNDPVSLGKAPSAYAGYTGSTWNVGDTSYNTAPAAGGVEGWKCTTSGSSTTAVFESFGSVSRGA